MHFIYGLPACPPLCPPLGNDSLVSSSEENLRHRTNFFSDQKLSTYAKQIGRHFIFSSFSSSPPKENLYDEEFDEISLSDNYDVSLLEYNLSSYFYIKELLKENNCLFSFNFIEFSWKIR
jgi:hypothetical protein